LAVKYSSDLSNQRPWSPGVNDPDASVWVTGGKGYKGDPKGEMLVKTTVDIGIWFASINWFYNTLPAPFRL